MTPALHSHQVSDLVVAVEPLAPRAAVRQVADLFLSEQHRELLCLPVVDDRTVVGTISRYTIMKIYLQPFGREIFGTQSVVRFMNPRPILIDAATDIDRAAFYVRTQIAHPITEDFVILQDNAYLGMGMVLSLLEKMEKRAEARNKTLRTVNERLKSSQTRLIQSEKMASLGQMVAGVAHEINTPLGYVQSNLELAVDLGGNLEALVVSCGQLIAALSSEDAGDSEIATAIEDTATQLAQVHDEQLLSDMSKLFGDSLHGLSQIGELVVNLRNFSRHDHAPLSQVNLNECLDSALNIGHHITKQKAEIVREYDEDTRVDCIASQINQVLLNILTNAAQAIDGFGKIYVKTRAYEQHVDLHIRDTGRGMSDAVRRKIFDPFFTTKAVGEGTGLGLSIAYQIIEKHRGTIDVSSVENEGTEFTIRLPRSQHNNAAMRPAQ